MGKSAIFCHKSSQVKSRAKISQVKSKFKSSQVTLKLIAWEVRWPMKTGKDFQRIRILSLFLDRSTLRKQLLILITQVDDSGHRILQERYGKVIVSCRKAPEIAGTWKQYSGRKIFGFSSGGFLPTSCAFRQEVGGKHRKNFRPEYCFQNINGITRNWSFPGRTLRPGYIFLLHFQISTQNWSA